MTLLTPVPTATWRSAAFSSVYPTGIVVERVWIPSGTFANVKVDSSGGVDDDGTAGTVSVVNGSPVTRFGRVEAVGERPGMTWTTGPV